MRGLGGYNSRRVLSGVGLTPGLNESRFTPRVHRAVRDRAVLPG